MAKEPKKTPAKKASAKKEVKKVAPKKVVPKKTGTKKIAVKKIIPKKEVHIPREKEIKKRALLFFSVAVLFLAVMLFVGNGIFTGTRFNKAQNNISELQNELSTQNESFNETFKTFTNFQEEFRKDILIRISEIKQGSDNNTALIETFESQVEKVEDQMIRTDEIISNFEAQNEALRTYVEDIHTQAIEQHIQRNTFFVEMLESQIEYLQEQNKDVIKNKIETPEFETIEAEEVIPEPVVIEEPVIEETQIEEAIIPELEEKPETIEEILSEDPIETESN